MCFGDYHYCQSASLATIFREELYKHYWGTKGHGKKPKAKEGILYINADHLGSGGTSACASQYSQAVEQQGIA